MFRGAVRGRPEGVAVRDENTALTYTELDARSDSFAQTLRDRGIGREDHVAYCLDRGVQVYVALLGILKAGAAYVPVDARYPDARRDLMITESQPSLVVTEPGWATRLASLGDEDLDILEFVLDDHDKPLREELPEAEGVDAAAVLFTSGSSGKPKAVVLEHRNLVHFATNPALPALTSQDRVGAVSSLSFDAFHWETWCGFAGGAEIVVLPTMPDLLTRDIKRELRRRRITAMLVPTMAVNHVVREDREAFADLRVLCTGGDVVLASACRELLAGTFSGLLYNLYGPTEGATACTAHHVAELAADADSVPIGRALDGSFLYVLDSTGAPVAEGEAGELFIGGPGVARGYLGRPDLTDEKFHPDRFAAGGGRMYATGDVVRRDGDGVLSYVGRADDQVKIRGYRVEPREVERILTRCAGIQDVAVLAVGSGSDKHLVALVVNDDSIPLNQLRAYAEREMPDFMVPSSISRVTEIPANSHGKRDLARLRDLADETLRRSVDHVAPRDEIERYLADLWVQLLAVEQVGATDEFFALGGNSLLSFRMLRRLTRDLDVQVSAREVLATGRLEDLARLIRDRKDSKDSKDSKGSQDSQPSQDKEPQRA
ncbi:non-ribosomal peptide synthetase [Streptomyces sp. NBC_01264]|uniref:non-ribosomal peptide synthetase n=1 Tax=Streptomyces sp. NBC_01264 TaxID=2903804 RepID=UPI002259C07E|nr:non-ribosomal peptide synthetase [Streptomyces sp. NBC_01264]MCX4778459.1 non-ribosomal peptide synthetase [Streptomyces sp. NBC_01264]